MPSKSLSIIVPAFNEERNIRATCVEVARIAGGEIPDYEILVIDDASQDRTAEIVRELQKSNPRIILIQNQVNRGLGHNYRIGISKARCDYAIMVPGDNEMVAESLEEIFGQVGTADAIICYSENPEVRPQWRQAISKLFTFCVNFLFGLRVRYYNGPSLIRTDLARAFAPSTSSFAYMAVILIQLLKSGASYKEMSFRLRHRPFGRTKAFRPKNVVKVIWDILALFWKVKVRRQLKSLPIRPAQSAGVVGQQRIGS